MRNQKAKAASATLLMETSPAEAEREREIDRDLRPCPMAQIASWVIYNLEKVDI